MVQVRFEGIDFNRLTPEQRESLHKSAAKILQDRRKQANLIHDVFDNEKGRKVLAMMYERAGISPSGDVERIDPTDITKPFSMERFVARTALHENLLWIRQNLQLYHEFRREEGDGGDG